MIKKNDGFSLHLVVAVVVGIALLGVVVWRVIDANNSQSNNAVDNNQVESTNQEQSQTTEQQETVDPNEGYVVIKEWGVRFKPVEGLVGVEYSVPSSPDWHEGDLETITFTTKKISSLEPNCSLQVDDDILSGLLYRFQKDEEYSAMSGGIIAEIGDYRYQYRGTDAACSENPDNYSVESEEFISISESLKSLEAAQ